MMIYDNPIRLVRELKGAPLSIVMALMMVQGRVSNGWLEQATGYSDKPISKALAYLREIGLVDCNSAGWGLCAGQQLPLMAVEVEADGGAGGGAIHELPLHESPLPDPDDNSEGESPSRRNSDYLINTNNPVNNNSELVVINEPSRRNSDSALIQALQAAGIAGQKLKELSQRADLRPEDVPAWERELRRRVNGRYSTGLLIHVLESGERLPVKEPQGWGICPHCNRFPCDCEVE